MSSLIINDIYGLCPCQGDGVIHLDDPVGGVPLTYDWDFKARGDRWSFEVRAGTGVTFSRSYPYDEVGGVKAGYMRPYQAAAIIWRCYEDFVKEQSHDAATH